MSKQKLRYGHTFIKCPICKSQTFDYCSYSEFGFGTVEQHGYCDRCGYTVEQAYSGILEAFCDTKKGFKNSFGEYYPKNVKKHKKVRRKLNIVKHIEVNPKWVFYI